MNEEKRAERGPQAGAEPQPKKKPYHKPEFLCERVFETTALSCGKLPQDVICKSNKKHS